MDYSRFILRDPQVRGGAPVIAGTRVTLRTNLASLAEGAGIGEILSDFPALTKECLDLGRSLNDISLDLNAEGVPTRNNGSSRWSSGTLSKILKCPDYLGEITVSRFITDAKGKIIAHRPESEPELIKRWREGDRRKPECVSENACFGPASDGRGLYCVTMANKRSMTKSK